MRPKLLRPVRWTAFAAAALLAAACSDTGTDVPSMDELEVDAAEFATVAFRDAIDANGGSLPDWFEPQRYFANGDVVRTISGAYSQGSCSVNTGIAFDGTNLIMSCYSYPVLDILDPADGSLVGTYTVPGIGGAGALAWDNTTKTLWVCADFNNVVQFDPSSGTVVSSFFAPNSCFDGLAYDGNTNTILTSGDVQSYVYEWQTDGTLISQNYIRSIIGGGNSGIAAGGDKLYLASNPVANIFEVERDFSAGVLFASVPRRVEDMECDDVTFNPDFSVIWQQDAYDRIIQAFEIPAGACPFGGGVDPDPNVAPAADASATTTVVECAGDVTTITLDGSASMDSDGSIVSWDWSLGGASVGSGEVITTDLPAGSYEFTLTVTDDDGDSSSTTVTVDIVDTTAPTVSFSLDVTEIWPPNHNMVTVATGVTASDSCCGDVDVDVTVTSNEDINGTGDGNTDPDWVVVDNGDGTYDVQVRAERDGDGSGRIYTVTVTATDCAGNQTVTSGEVTVPHSKGKGKK